MNHIYRLVWCRSRNALVAVSELSSSRLRIGTSAGTRSGAVSGGAALRLLTVALIGAGGLVHAGAACAQSSGDGKLDDLQSLMTKYDHSPVIGSQAGTASGTVANVVGAPVTVVSKLAGDASGAVSVTRQVVSSTASQASTAGLSVGHKASQALAGAATSVRGVVGSVATGASRLPVAGTALSGVGATASSISKALPAASAQAGVFAHATAAAGQGLVADVNSGTALAVSSKPVLPVSLDATAKATAGLQVNAAPKAPAAPAPVLDVGANVAAQVQVKLPAAAPVAEVATQVVGDAGQTLVGIAKTVTGQPAGAQPAVTVSGEVADRRKDGLDLSLGAKASALVDLGSDGNSSSGSESTAISANANVDATASLSLPSSLGSSSALTVNAPVQASLTAALPQDVPVLPPPSATPTGLVVGNGGLVGAASQLLGTTENSLFSNSSGYVSNGSLRVDNANFSQGYSTVNLLGLPLLNLTPVGTLLTTTGGTVLGGTGVDSHLTLLGGVTSNSYIDNINNGAAGGLLGVLLPGQAPAWASTCLNVLGIVKESCWAVNAAQDNQVLVGDGATANGSEEVVIGTNASHTLASVDACTAFPGKSPNDPTNPCGVPTDDYQAREGHSVVIGDSASGTANAQTILGANATSNVANSVALGYASAANRGAQANYTAFGLSALQNSAGEVSIGSPGQERQITNVAAGSSATDAVNLAQLEGVAATADNAVVYNDASKATVILGGTASTDGGQTNGTLISNLHQGSLSATSTDAVNGAQLFATNNNINNVFNTGTKYFQADSTGTGSMASGANSVAAGQLSVASGVSAIAIGNGAQASSDQSVAIGNGASVTSGSAVSIGSSNTASGNGAVAVGDPDTATGQGAVAMGYNNTATGQAAIAMGSTSTANGASAIALGDTASATAANAIALGANANANMANSIALGAGSSTQVGALTNYTAVGLTAPQTSVGEVNVGNRQVTGVAAGSAADDAVNVAQLEGVAAVAANAVQYDNAGKTSVTLAGPASTDGGQTNGTTITNLHQGNLSATSTDAVNGAQLYATNSSINNIYNSGVKYFHANSTLADAAASGTDSVAIGPLANATGNSSVALGNAAVAAGDNALALGGGASASMANSIALGAGSSTQVGALANYTAIGLTAVQNSAGELNIGNRQITGVAAGSAADDAVNVAQLEGVSNQVTAVDKLAVKYDADSAGNPTNTITLVGAGSGGQVSITNLAAGAESATSTDAVNGSQLWHWTQDTTNIYSNASLYNDFKSITPGGGGSQYLSVNSTLGGANATGSNSVAVGPTAQAAGNNSVAMGNGASASADNSVALGAGSVADRANTVSVGSAGNERQITNVAAGTQSTDAVNLGQMDSAISASSQGSVHYDTNTNGTINYGSITLGNGSGDTTIHNVAAGTATTDAVNVGQLTSGIQQAENWAQNYTDQKFNAINNQIQRVGNRANAGVAAAMAMAGLPQAYEPGKSMAAVSAGTFRGESSMAIGISTISEGGRWVYKLTASGDTRGDAGASVGVGMQW